MDRLWELNIIPNNLLKEFMDNIDTAIIEVQGIAAIGRRGHKHNQDFISQLQKLKKKVLFVTSETTEPIQDIVKVLKAFNVKAEDITTPNELIRTYLKKKNKNDDTIFLVGGDLLKYQLIEDGHTVIASEEARMIVGQSGLIMRIETIREMIESELKNVKFIVLAEDNNFDMVTAQIIAELLQHNGHIKVLNSTSRDLYCIPFRQDIVGPKFYMDAIARWAHKRVINLGQPGEYMSKLMIKKYGIKDPSRVLSFGYSIDTDVAFGLKAGFKTCLIINESNSNHEIEDNSRPADALPHLVVYDLRQFVHKLFCIYPDLKRLNYESD